MKSSEMVELAALVATHGSTLITDSLRLSQNGLKDYWSASRCRIDRWGRVLRRYQRNADYLGPRWAKLEWPRVAPTFHEIIILDVLGRVWMAVVTAHDRQLQTDEAEPIVRSIFVGHTEARNRALQLTLKGPTARPSESENTVRMDSLDRWRRCSERWTDLLIGYLIVRHDVAEFAYDAERANDFADDIQRQEKAGVGQEAWLLTLRSLRSAYQSVPFGPSVNADLNATIAGSILACFDSELIGSVGEFRSLWTTRLLNHTSDASRMIDELLELDRDPLPDPGQERPYQ